MWLISRLFGLISTLWICQLVSVAAQDVNPPALTIELPKIGVYSKNYRGDITKIISENINSEVKLPILKYEDHTWEGKSIELICNASYPVIWKYNGYGAPAVHTITYRKLVSDVSLIYQFIATVVFTHTTAKQTGNYTCESIQNPQIQHSYVYVFVPGDALFLTDIEETETVTINSYDPWITLPCSVSDYDVKAILFKKHSSGNIEVLRTDENLIYDSKIGFQMKWTSYKNPTGIYYCVARNQRNVEQLEIKVEFSHKISKKLDTSNTPYWSKQTRSKYVKFIVDRRNNRIVCCSTRNHRPTMKSTGCNSWSDCEIRRKYLEAKKCPPTCEQHIVKVGRTCVAYQLGDWRDNGILQCSYNYTVSKSEYLVFSKYDDNIITNFKDFPPTDQILEVFMDDSPNTEKVYISCHANSFFFSEGIKWGIKKPNASFQFLPETNFPSPITIELDKMEYAGSDVYCFAPIWNSPTEWRHSTIMIK